MSRADLGRQGPGTPGHDMTNSHLLVHQFEYAEPSSVEEAISLLVQHGPSAQLLAGGTFLLVQMKMEQVAPACLVSLGKVHGLDGLQVVDGYLEVGPSTRIWDLKRSARVQRDYQALAEACAAFGSTQVQMSGTLGGNVCNGSPASDTVPALAVLGAELVLLGPDGERTVPMERFLIGPGETALANGELLKAIRLPEPRPGTGSAFVKVSRVRADLAKASAAATIVRDGDYIVDCRIALGSVGPTVLRARKAEQMLIGTSLTSESALAAGRVAAEEVTPIDDIRSSAWYRREVVKALTHDALQAAWGRAGEGGGVEGPAGAPTGSDRSPAASPASELETLHLLPADTHRITLVVDGEEHRLDVKPSELLINVLRERLSLTGTKYGCGIGECGACTVLLDGMPILACLTLAVSVDMHEVTTVEGLQPGSQQLDPLQEAFIENAGFQCGYCTPGILMMTKRLLADHRSAGLASHASEGDVRDYLKGNRCRCTGFASVVRAVMSCAAD